MLPRRRGRRRRGRVNLRMRGLQKSESQKEGDEVVFVSRRQIAANFVTVVPKAHLGHGGTGTLYAEQLVEAVD